MNSPQDSFHSLPDEPDHFTSLPSSPAHSGRETAASTSSDGDIGALRRENEFLRAQLAISRQRMETAVRDSQDRLRLIFENARDFAIFSMDLDRRVTSWNPGAERILGFSEAEILGQSGDVIFTPEDKLAKAPEQEQMTALSKGRALDERWHLRRDGSRLWGSGFMMAMNDADGNAVGMIKIFRDQTEARNTSEALRKSHEELAAAALKNEEARRTADAAAAAKDDFLAALSHELRTPLNPALMIIAALEQDLSLPEDVRSRMTTVRCNIELEARLIDDLLDVTRITRRMITLTPTSCDLHDLLRRTAEIVLSAAPGHEVRLEFDYGAADHWVTGEPSRLQQILWNLLKNAFKFTGDGGKVLVRTSNPVPGLIEISVADTGIGITREAQERIFEPFEQGDEKGRHRFGGLGLGLAISRALALLHGGKLRVSSPGEGQGSTFTLELKTSPAPKLQAPAQMEPNFIKRPLRLLVVEDHQPTLNAMVWHLERDGHTVFPAPTGRAALAIADREICDVLISDIGLPDLSGLDLMREIKRLHGWPGIALSGYGMPEDIAQSKEAGFELHLIKPIKTAVLRQALLELMELPSSASRFYREPASQEK